MPKDLKVLVHISTWVLFVLAWVILINFWVENLLGGIDAQWTMTGFGIAIVSFMLAAVAALIRKKLE